MTQNTLHDIYKTILKLVSFTAFVLTILLTNNASLAAALHINI